LAGEFQKQLEDIIDDAKTSQEVLEMIKTAGAEFPCLSCPSKAECGSFKWFTKWFGEAKP
jgi:hypothetical protein